jgi:hypothetical protein
MPKIRVTKIDMVKIAVIWEWKYNYMKIKDGDKLYFSRG